MAIYTTVDEGYEVDVYTSFEKLWRFIPTEDCFLDKEKKITKNSLAAALRVNGEARIYPVDPEGADWILKIRKH